MEIDRRKIGGPVEIVSRKAVARARRYEINTAMQYRISREKQWREGIVENISISGALIRARFLELKTELEIRFSLPIHLRDEHAAAIYCRGSVVRSSKSDISDEPAEVAVKIEFWRFLRQKDRKSDSSSVLRISAL